MMSPRAREGGGAVPVGVRAGPWCRGALPASWPRGWGALVARLRARLSSVGLPRSRIIGNAFGCYQFTPPSDVWVDVEAALAAVDAAEGAIAAGDAFAAYRPSLIAVTVLRRPFLTRPDGARVA